MKTHLANNTQVVPFKYDDLLLKPLDSEIAKCTAIGNVAGLITILSQTRLDFFNT